MELEDAFAHMDNIEATYGGDTPLVDAVRDMAKRVEAEVETRDKKETTKIERKMGKGWSLPSKQADAVLQVVAKNPKVQPATIVRFLAQKGTKVSINLVQKLRMNGQKSPKKG
jgi:hypothetical protein